MVAKKKYQGLGRGLDSLIPTEERVTTRGASGISEIPLSRIVANPSQPRREFDAEALEELTESIRQIGIIQPITVREMPDGTYQIIAGERRWRASQAAGLQKMPAYVRVADEERLMEMALIENVQREDLNAIEIAMAYQNLIEQFGLTQEQLSEKVGKRRATIANSLRLLRLPAEVQMALRNKEIDAGHARALLAIPSPQEQVRLFREVQKHGYSVRQVEELAREMTQAAVAGKQPAARKQGNALAAEYEELRAHLAARLRTKVTLQRNARGAGKISIAFQNDEQLAALIQRLDKVK